nr:EndoU domain-containing protein [Enterococcus rivorum]
MDRGKDATKVAKNIETLDDLKKLKNTDVFTDKSLKHVFEGELTKRGASGYHVDTIDGSIGKIIDGTKTAPNKYGVYEAKVEVDGVLKGGNGGKSTFFPDDWSSQKVVDSINEAYKNRKFEVGSFNTYTGVTKEGFTISMFIGKDGKIISAFPKY